MTILHSEAPKVAQADFGVFHRVADDKPVNTLAQGTPAGLRRGGQYSPSGTPKVRGRRRSMVALHATFASRMGGRRSSVALRLQKSSVVPSSGS